MTNNQILYDLTKLEKLSGGDSNFLNRMIQIFIRDTPFQLENIRIGFENNDAEMIRFAAHRLKPAIQNICINEIIEEVTLIEKEAELKKVNDALFLVSKNFEFHITILIKQLSEKLY